MPRTRALLRTRTWAVALFAFVLACKGSGPAKDAASASAASPPLESLGPSGTPRHDGVYAAKAQAPDGSDVGWDFLRFLADGRVLSVSSPGAIEKAVALLFDDGNGKSASGKVETPDGGLRFVLESKLGKVSYVAALQNDQLQVRWHSDINGATAEQVYAFVPVEEQDDKDKDKKDTAPTAEAPLPTKEPESAPPGAGWYCYHGSGSGTSRCERSLSDCQATRKQAASMGGNRKLTKCARQKTAFCYTLTKKSSGEAASICFANGEDCSASNAEMSKNPNASSLTFSGCDEQ